MTIVEGAEYLNLKAYRYIRGDLRKPFKGLPWAPNLLSMPLTAPELFGSEQAQAAD